MFTLVTCYTGNVKAHMQWNMLVFFLFLFKEKLLYAIQYEKAFKIWEKEVKKMSSKILLCILSAHST
jgi:hypothetical protein